MLKVEVWLTLHWTKPPSFFCLLFERMLSIQAQMNRHLLSKQLLHWPSLHYFCSLLLKIIPKIWENKMIYELRPPLTITACLLPIVSFFITLVMPLVKLNFPGIHWGVLHIVIYASSRFAFFLGILSLITRFVWGWIFN